MGELVKAMDPSGLVQQARELAGPAESAAGRQTTQVASLKRRQRAPQMVDRR